VEKPKAPTLGECREMIEAARQQRVTLAVGHKDWSPPLVKARELIGDGAIGVPISATIAISSDSPPAGVWRQDDPTELGGGPLLDVGVHAIDTIQQLMGPVVRVAAFMDHHIHRYAAEDTTTTLLRFASGAHGVLHAHFNCSANAFEIVGTKGHLRSAQWLGRDFAGNLSLQRGDSITTFDLPRVNVYVPEVEHVSECVLAGRAPAISGERGMANMAVIWGAIRSARTGAVVDVG
jgi:predicted dehydrogenase